MIKRLDTQAGSNAAKETIGFIDPIIDMAVEILKFGSAIILFISLLSLAYASSSNNAEVKTRAQKGVIGAIIVLALVFSKDVIMKLLMDK